MKRGLMFGMLFLTGLTISPGQDSGKALRQSYNGKFGFYRPDPSLSNGLAFGIDGMTEFVRYDFFGSLGADLYLKQSFNPFKNPPGSIQQQSLILIPIMVGVGYKVVDIADADTRLYLGAGAGYSLFFYSVQYSSGGGGGILGSLPSSTTHDKSSGMFTASAQMRVVIGRIFLEPKMYFAGAKEETAEGGYAYRIDPSGFIITLGYSYQ